MMFSLDTYLQGHWAPRTAGFLLYDGMKKFPPHICGVVVNTVPLTLSNTSEVLDFECKMGIRIQLHVLSHLIGS